MFCTQCGADNPDTAKFCSSCGTPLVQPGEVVQPDNAPDTQPQPMPEATVQPDIPGSDVGAAQPSAYDPTMPGTPAPEISSGSQAPQPVPGQYQPDMPAYPQAPQMPPAPVKQGGMPKWVKIAIIIVAVLLVIVGLVTCLSPGKTDQGGNTTPENGNANTTSSVSNLGASAADFVGAWELYEGEAEGLEPETIVAFHALGYNLTLTLTSDGGGSFVSGEDEYPLEWALEDGKAKVEWSGEGNEFTMSFTAEGDLVLTDLTGASMFFEKSNNSPASTSAGSASASNANGNSNASGSPSASNASNTDNANSSTSYDIAAVQKKHGKKATGYISVPARWEDCTSEDIGERMAESADITYIVDPDTEYVSPSQSHFAFSNAIQLAAYPTDYKSYAKELEGDFKSDGYSDIDSMGGSKFCGHDSVVVTATSEDGTVLTGIVFDINDDGHSCAAIIATATPATAEKVLAYVSSWSAS